MNNMTSIEEIVKYQQELLTQQEDQKNLQKETFKLLNELNKNLTFMAERLDEFAFKINIKLDESGTSGQQHSIANSNMLVPNSNVFVTNMNSASSSSSSSNSSVSILNTNGVGGAASHSSTDSSVINAQNQNFFTQSSNHQQQHLTESINVIDITNLLASATATINNSNNSNQQQQQHISVLTHNQNTANAAGPLTPNKNSISVLTKVEASSPILTPLTTITTNTLNTNSFNSRGNFLLCNNNNNDSTNSSMQHQQQQTNQLQILQQLHYPIKNPTKTQKVKEYFLSNGSNDSNNDSSLLERQRSQSQQQQQPQQQQQYIVQTTANTNGVLKHNNFINNTTFTHVNANTNNSNKSPNKSNNISSLINSLEYNNSANNSQQHSQNQLQQQQQSMVHHDLQKAAHPSPTSKLLDTTNLNSNGNKISTSDESIDDLSNYEESSDEEKETIQFKKKPKLSNDSSPSNNTSQSSKPKDEESHNQQRLFNKYVRESVECRLGKDFLLLHEIQEIDQEVMELIKKDALQHYPPINIRPRRAWHLAKASLRCRRRSLRRQKEKQITSTGNSAETLPQASSTLTRGAVAAIATVAESVAASLSAGASSTLN